MSLEGYASPHLRKAVFDKLHPNSQVEYEIIPLDEAFPHGHHDVAGMSEAEEAIICTLITETGQFFQGAKEIELMTLRKGSKSDWIERPQTPEAYTVDCTKALGRALRDAGIPQKIVELKLLMDALWPRPITPKPIRTVNTSTGEIEGGEPRELTLEQQVAVRVADLPGPTKATVANWARETLKCGNIAKAGEHAQAIMDHLDASGL